MPGIISNYIEVHIAVKEENDYKFLLLKRNENDKVYPGIWQMITGGVMQNESIREGVIREIKEETGINPSQVYSMPRVNAFYFDYGDAVCLSPVFLAIAENKNVSISDEHTEFIWVSYEEAIKLIHWPDQIESLMMIERYLKDELLFRKLFRIK